MKKLMRKKLALMLANLKKKRPYYCEVEYIEGSGTQYIDTGIYRTDNGLSDGSNLTSYQFKGVIEYTSMGVRRLMGDSGSHNGFWGIAANNKFETGTTSTYTASANTKYKIDFTATAEDMTLVVNLMDGTEAVNFSRTATVPTKVTNATFDILALGGNFVNSGVRIYRYQIYINNNLMGDFIPCLDWDMTPCMYDKVSGQLFYNAGTGDFIVGREIHTVDYLESTGVEYIDTGIKFDGANTKIEVKIYEDSLTRIHSICGDDGNYFYYFRGTGNWAVGYNSTAFNADSYMVVGDNVFVLDKNNLYLNGVLAKTYTASSTVSSYNALLFNRKTTRPDSGAVTMYYCKIWNNDVLVRDYIPAIDENGVGYMFDRVSHTCFLNQGTGAFKYPPRELEYLQSTGTQYIDTLYNMSDIRKIDMEIDWSGHTTSRREIMGSATSGGYLIEVGTAGYYGLGSTNYSTVLAEHKDLVSWQWDGENTYPKLYINNVLACTDTLLRNPVGTFKTAIADSWATNSKIYWFNIFDDNNAIVRELIPAFKDGVAGMLDKTNNVFYANAGSGTFITSKIVEPEYE